MKILIKMHNSFFEIHQRLREVEVILLIKKICIYSYCPSRQDLDLFCYPFLFLWLYIFFTAPKIVLKFGGFNSMDVQIICLKKNIYFLSHRMSMSVLTEYKYQVDRFQLLHEEVKRSPKTPKSPRFSWKLRWGRDLHHWKMKSSVFPSLELWSDLSKRFCYLVLEFCIVNILFFCVSCFVYV